MLEIDELGLDKVDQKIMEVIIKKFRLEALWVLIPWQHPQVKKKTP